MATKGYSNLADLKEWANTAAARSEFPRLIRRLILETTTTLTELGVPAGESVSTGGWDGTCQSTSATLWVPEGSSRWELSVGKSCGTKANRDFEKRTSAHDDSIARDVTYVQAILRPWGKRSEWAREKAVLGHWADVRALGLDDIDQWLEAAPATHAWFSELVGLRPHGLMTAREFWDSWSMRTKPAFCPELVLAGRQVAVEKLMSTLAGGPKLTTVGNPNLDEINAFIAASALTTDQGIKGQPASRLLFVDSTDSWRQLLREHGPLVLVPSTPEIATYLPSDLHHHVLIPSSSPVGVDIEIGALNRPSVEEVLCELGCSGDQARKLSHLARKSMTAMRRAIARAPALNVPAWASTPVRRSTRAALMAHSWSEATADDRGVLQQLAGTTYDTLREDLVPLSDPTDPLVQLFADGWSLVAPQDAWPLLSQTLSLSDLENFKAVSLQVLGEEDPALTYPIEDRWRASLDGVARRHSATLRRGLSTSIALMATTPTSATPGNPDSAQWSRGIVRELVHGVLNEGSSVSWNTILPAIQDLAEAAPEFVLEALSNASEGDNPPLADLFQDSETNDGLLGPSSPHSTILFTLEMLARSPVHFAQAVEVLTSLDRLDPGGRLGNRPMESLKGIFSVWCPQTSASADARLSALDSLIRASEDQAWALLLSMIPSRHATQTEHPAPRFRDWGRANKLPSTEEFHGMVEDVVQRLLRLAGRDLGRWASLLDEYEDLSPEHRTRLRAGLQTIGTQTDVTDSEARTYLWRTLRDLAHRHRRFQKSDWSVPLEEVNQLDEIVASLTPSNPIDVSLELFEDYHPFIPGVDNDDFDTYDVLLAQKRREAVRRIADVGGLQAIRDAAARPTTIQSIGFPLAQAVGDRFLSELLGEFNDAPPEQVPLAAEYLFGRFRTDGWPWLDRAIGDIACDLTAESKGQLLALSRDFDIAPERAASHGASVEAAYWKHVSVNGLGADFPHVAKVARALLSVKRPFAAVDLISLYIDKGSHDRAVIAGLVEECLHALLNEGDSTQRRPFRQLQAERLFALLAEYVTAENIDSICTLEFAFMSLLGSPPEMPTWHKRMSSEPAFYVYVVKIAKPGRTQDDSIDRTAASPDRSIQASNILRGWKLCPGTRADGTLDNQTMVDWVTTSLRLLEEAGLHETGSHHIGKMLTHAPGGSPDTEPAVEVRDLLESVRNDALEQGVASEIAYHRGPTMRSLEAGGAEEHAIAADLRDRAQNLQATWPRTALQLRNAAKTYDWLADQNDVQAERTRRGDDDF